METLGQDMSEPGVGGGGRRGVKVSPSDCLLLLLNNLTQRIYKTEMLQYVVCCGCDT